MNSSEAAPLRQECYNSKLGIFWVIGIERKFADALLTGIVS